MGLALFSVPTIVRPLLLQFDTAALMGYTGAVYQQFFGSGLGIFIAAGVLLLWAAVPLWIAVRRFERLDL